MKIKTKHWIEIIDYLSDIKIRNSELLIENVKLKDDNKKYIEILAKWEESK
jgi:hypothetical protein